MKKLSLMRCFLFLAVTIFQLQAKSQTIDSLSKVLKGALADTTKLNTLNALAFEFRSNNPDTAIYFANEALILATKLNDKAGLANSYLYLGMAKMNLGSFEEAIKNANQAITLFDQLLTANNVADKTKILKQKANAFNTIGNIFYYQSNYPESLKNYITALKFRLASGDKKDIATSYSNIGNIYVQQGNYQEALKNHFGALRIREQIGDKQGIGFSYANIGNIYGLQNNYVQALKNHFLCLKINQETGDKYFTATSYNNIGIIYAAQGNYPEALKYHIDALKIREEIRDKRGIGYSLNSIGNIYKDKGNDSEALKNFIACMEIGEETQEKLLIQYANINIGYIYAKQKKNKEAFQYLNRGLSLAKEIGSLEDIKQSYSALSYLDSASGNFKQALEDYKMAVLYRDSLVNEANSKKLVQSQMQYEFDKKESETKTRQETKDVIVQKELQKQKLIKNASIVGLAIIVFFSILVFVQQKRLTKEKRLREIATMRSRISQDMHDDVSSGLTKISWMSELLKAKVEKNNFNEITPTLEKIIDSSRETIGKLSEIIWATNPQHDNFESMLSYMRNYILKFFEDTPFHVTIDFPNQVENVKVNPELIRNLFLVMKEALHNAVKYSGAQNIKVHFSFQNNKYLFTIGDDGKGLDGYEVQGSGNGLINMKQRIESINGKFELITVNGKGTEIKIEGDVV